MADLDHAKLKAEFFGSFDWKSVKRPQFANWARNKRNPHTPINEHLWTPMQKGKPVPLRMIEALSEYLIDVLEMGGLDDYGVEAISEHSGEVTKTNREDDAWRLNFPMLFLIKSKPYKIPEEAFCHNEADIVAVSSMIMHAFGFRKTKSSNKSVCIDFARQDMKRTQEEYGRLLFDSWRANESSVLFAVREFADGTMERFGSSVVIPVTKAFYRRFQLGNAEDIDVAQEDLPGDSMHILLDAVSENMEIDTRKEKAKRSMLQAETVLYQLAASCSPLNSWSANPSIITFGGEPEGVKRLESYHFKEVGTRTPLTGKPVMEFAPPPEGRLGLVSPIDLSHYLAMKSILLIYQLIRSRSLLLDF